MSIDKDRLRVELLTRHESLTEQDVAEASSVVLQRVLELLQQLPNSPSKVHIYPTPSKWQEIDTRQLVRTLKQEYHAQVDQPDMTPQAEFSDEKYDVIFVPCLGFDERCQRLGRGYGWYDRFLATQPKALKIGLGFEVAHSKALPNEAHDQPLDVIITERKVYSSHGKVL